MGGGASVVVSESDASGFPVLGISLSYYEEFFALCGGKAALKNLSTAEVCEKFVKPATASAQSSFCAWLHAQNHPGVAPAQVFISHAWSFQFLDVVEALTDHFENTPNVVVWFDLFSNNQHMNVSKPFEWWCDVFKSNIAAMQHVVMVLAPWHSPVPLKRAWCLFELYCSASTHCRFEIAMSKFQQGEFLKAIAVNTEQEIKNLFSHIDCAASEATVQSDKVRIFEVVERTVGFDAINSMVFEQLRKWMIHTAEKALHQQRLHAHDPLRVDHDAKTGDLVEENPKNRVIAQVETELALGSLYVNQGKFGEAEPIFVDCLQLAKAELGHDHPCTNAARNNLAVLYDAQGKYDEAEDLLLLVLKLNHLAQEAHDAQRKAQKEARARDTHKHIDLAHSTDQEDHDAFVAQHRLRDERLTTMNNLASVYMSQQKLELALELYQTCYRQRRDSLHELKTATATATASTAAATQVTDAAVAATTASTLDATLVDAAITRSQPASPRAPLVGDEGSAGAITGKSAKLHTAAHHHHQSHGPARASTASTTSTASFAVDETQRLRYEEELFSIMNNLATVHEKLEQYDDAEAILRQCIQAQRQLLGDDHLDTLMTEANLAGIFFSQGKFADAEPLLIVCLDRRRVLLGDDNPIVLATMQSLAMTLFSQQKYAEAEDLLIPCLEHRKQLLGDTHPQTIDTISTLAMVFNAQGAEKQDEAEVFFVLAYETQRRVAGADHVETLEYMSNLAVFYANIDEKSRSEALARECWSRCVAHLGPEHPLAFNLAETFPFLLEEAAA